MKNKGYRNWVKSLECCMCGAPADDTHHLIGVGHMGGIGMKAPDWATMPLCRIHHDEMHADPKLWPDQWIYLSRTLTRAFEEGMIDFK